MNLNYLLHLEFIGSGKSVKHYHLRGSAGGLEAKYCFNKSKKKLFKKKKNFFLEIFKNIFFLLNRYIIYRFLFVCWLLMTVMSVFYLFSQNMTNWKKKTTLILISQKPFCRICCGFAHRFHIMYSTKLQRDFNVSTLEKKKTIF